MTGCGVTAETAGKRGEELLSGKKYDEAEIEFRKSIQKDPNYAPAHLGLGQVLLEKNKELEAAQSLRAAVRLDPKALRQKFVLADLLLSAYIATGRKGGDLRREAGALLQEAAQSGDNSFDRWRLEGALHVADEHWEEAVESFRKALPLSPAEDQTARLALSQSLFRDGKRDEAREVVELRLATRRSWNEGYDQLYRMAMESGLPAGALAVLERKRTAMRNEGVWVSIARHHARGGALDEMRAALGKIPANAPAAVHFAAGEFLRERGEMDAALASFRAGQASQPDQRWSGEKRILEVEIAKEDYAAARQRVETLRKQFDKDLGLAATRAWLMTRSAQPSERKQGIEALKLLAGQNAKEAILPFKLAELAREAGDWKETIRQCNEALRRDRNFEDARLLLGEAHLSENNAAEAMRLARILVARNPTNWSARLLYASADGMQGRLSEARREYEALLAERPGNLEVRTRLGFAALAENRLPEAEKIFREVYRPGQKDLRPVTGLAAILTRQQQAPAALRLLLEHGGEETKKARTRLAIQLATESGQYEAATRLCQESLAADANDSGVLRAYGDALWRQGNRAAAIAEVKKAAQASPNDAASWKTLAFMQAASGDAAGAESGYRQALRIEPAAKDARNNLAMLLRESGGKLEEAEKLARGLLSEDPGNLDYLDTLAWIQLGQGKANEALPVLANIALRQSRNPSAGYHYGVALLQTGDTQRGRKVLQDALAKGPDEKTAEGIRRALKQGG